VRVRSASSTLLWPPLVPSKASNVNALWLQLMQSQGLTAAQLVRLQDMQLAARLKHAQQTSSRFSPWLKGLHITPENAREVLAQLPLLTRADLQTQSEGVYCETGSWHGAVKQKKTTGSTGQPVMVRCTDAAFDLREAITLRNFSSFGLNPGASFAAIRSGVAKGRPDGFSRSGWGGVLGQLLVTGASHALDLATPVEQQMDWLMMHRPAY
jgi:phenylacetate-CoA ligase